MEAEILQQMYQLLQLNVLCDVTITTSDEEIVEAHACLLAAASSVLKELLMQQLSSPYQLHINYSMATFQTVLQHIYGVPSPTLSEEAGELFKTLGIRHGYSSTEITHRFDMTLTEKREFLVSPSLHITQANDQTFVTNAKPLPQITCVDDDMTFCFGDESQTSCGSTNLKSNSALTDYTYSSEEDKKNNDFTTILETSQDDMQSDVAVEIDHDNGEESQNQFMNDLNEQEILMEITNVMNQNFDVESQSSNIDSESSDMGVYTEALYSKNQANTSDTVLVDNSIDDVSDISYDTPAEETSTDIISEFHNTQKQLSCYSHDLNSPVSSEIILPENNLHCMHVGELSDLSSSDVETVTERKDHLEDYSVEVTIESTAAGGLSKDLNDVCLTYGSNMHVTYKCSYCDKSYRHLQNLYRHERAAHKHMLSYTCEICNEHFTDSTIYKRHVKEHTMINCNKCQSSFTSQLLLLKHERICHQSFMQTNVRCCPTCGEKFNTSVAYRNHLKTHSLQSLFCQDCQLQFTSKSGFKLHRKMHTEKTLECDLCKKKFIHSSTFHSHMRSHCNGGSCICKCGKKFATPSEKERHEKSHSFRCSKCPQSFSSESRLVAHEKAHTKLENLKWKCPICKKQFDCDETFKAHQPCQAAQYLCEICGGSYSSNASLKVHILTHNKFQTFPCQICDSVFSNKDCLRKHMQRHNTKKTK